MLLPLIVWVNALILSLLGLLHFYWATGGKWGADKAIPAELTGKKLFIPGPMVCIAVGTGLMIMALFLVSVSVDSMVFLPDWLNKTGIVLLAFIFTARAIGEFRYVGFFKKIKGTDFARLDTRFYSPLCLYLGLTNTCLAFNILGFI